MAATLQQILYILTKCQQIENIGVRIQSPVTGLRRIPTWTNRQRLRKFGLRALAHRLGHPLYPPTNLIY